GMLRAEIRDHGLVNGSGIGDGFGQDAGDSVCYRVGGKRPFHHPTLTLRYRLKDAAPARFRLEGIVNGEVGLVSQARDPFGFSQISLPINHWPEDKHLLRFISFGGAAVELDGFAITEAAQLDALQFGHHTWQPVPEIKPGPQPNSLLLHYPDVDLTYGLAWDHPDFWVRQLFNDELDTLLRFLVPNNYSERVDGPGDGHFTDVFLRPISLPAGSETAVYSLICAGTESEVSAMLANFAQQPTDTHLAIYRAGRETAVSPPTLPAGEKYRFSQQRMAATELMNVVYPVYTRRQFIRHNTPGKWWDCLYTWDSGFIGLAQLELDVPRAQDCLNAYLTEPGDAHAAFVHHGTPVPVQIYLFHELWNRTQDRAFLAAVYPSLRQYYLFLAGRLGSSTTCRLQSNLIITWEYFFESAGWDDYPAQMHVLADYLDLGNMQESGITINTACAALTAHLIRSAKILQTAASALNLPADQQLYAEDIAIFADALQRYAWDEASGYFSYVLHDENGRPTGHLHHESGLNFNMGLDGVMPLIAGICTPEQEDGLLNKLQDPQRFWTPLGLSTVDQSAPYYRHDGYWNGAVWFPHQWFLWKTALDLNQPDFAYQIAHTALDLWQREVAASYYCFEHFIIETGRGAGWHQFSGLSSPVVNWFYAYYHPGQLSTGFNIWVEEQQFSADKRAFTGVLRSTAVARPQTILLNLQPDGRYQATWNDEPILVQERHPGSLQITIPFATEVGELRVTAVPSTQKE
ncbi:MAG: trehalase family glycosidase, partial [Candidatus Promineifilaceae bacterium]